MIKIHDLAGLSAPLTRLIEVVAQGVGAVSTPYLIRKTAEARAQEIKTIAAALDQAGGEQPLALKYQTGIIEIWQKPTDRSLAFVAPSMDERAAARLDFQQRKKQENLEKITSVAAAELVKENTVPEEKPDDDWVTRFFGEAENISTQEMQKLWGRILAGEIKKPGSYSLRTLQFVKNITKSEAEVFERVGRLSLQKGRWRSFLFKLKNG